MNAARKTRILIIEDAESSFGLQENLQSLGFIADVAHDAEAANRANTTGEYAIMIHATMPTRCGSKRKWHDTPKIIIRRFEASISAVSYSQPEFKKQCSATGIADILEQPFSKDALYESICSLSLSEIGNGSYPSGVKISGHPSFHEMDGF
jgi:CheY-like chemotaxis protein